MSTELKNLEIDEASGVDAPAHGIPGWIVMKSEDGGAPTPEAAAAELATVYTAIGSASVLAGAPEEVRKAAEEVFKFAETQLTAPEPEPSLMDRVRNVFKGKSEPKVTPAKKSKAKAKVAPPDGTEDLAASNDSRDVVKSAVKKALRKQNADHEAQLEQITKAVNDEFDGMREVIKALIERIEAIEGDVVGSYQIDGQDYQPVEKSAPTLTDGIMAAFSGGKVTLS